MKGNLAQLIEALKGLHIERILKVSCLVLPFIIICYVIVFRVPLAFYPSNQLDTLIANRDSLTDRIKRYDHGSVDGLEDRYDKKKQALIDSYESLSLLVEKFAKLGEQSHYILSYAMVGPIDKGLVGDLSLSELSINIRMNPADLASPDKYTDFISFMKGIGSLNENIKITELEVIATPEGGITEASIKVKLLTAIPSVNINKVL